MNSASETTAADELNPYAPPAVDEPQPKKKRRAKKRQPSPYYALPIAKVIVFHFVTLGFFEMYWMYRQWCGIRDLDRVRIRPFWRAWFAIFFVHSLFNDVNQRSWQMQLPKVSAGVFAGMYALGILASNSSTLTNDALLLLIMELLKLIPVVVVQLAMNRHIQHCDPDADMNTKIGAGEVVVVSLGVAFWAAILTGNLGF